MRLIRASRAAALGGRAVVAGWDCCSLVASIGGVGARRSGAATDAGAGGCSTGTTEGATGVSPTIAGASFVSGALGASVTRGVGAGAAGAFSTAARVPVFGEGGCFWAWEWSRCGAHGGFLFDGAYDRRRDLIRGNHSHFAPGRFVFGQAVLGDVGPSLLIAVGNCSYLVLAGGRTSDSEVAVPVVSAGGLCGIANGPDIIETPSAPKSVRCLQLSVQSLPR